MVSFIIKKEGSYIEPSIRRVKCCVFVYIYYMKGQLGKKDIRLFIQQ